MIQNINYKPIPKTNLEIAAVGENTSRIIAFRTKQTIQPMQLCTAPRAIFIGTPQAEIRQAMRDGRLTREILDNIGTTLGGRTFTALRKSLDEYLKNNPG